MRVLGIETSSVRGSVALVEQGRVVVSAHHSALNRHAEETLGLIDRVLAEAGWSKTTLERVAASVGPGSFTGVRVGLSLASGISMGLGIQGLGLGSLRVVAAGERLLADGSLSLERSDVLTVVLRDARRGEYFLAAYDSLSAEELGPMTVPQEGAEAAVAARFLGRGHRLTRAEPDARAVALLAAQCLASDCPLNPHYVRDSGATPQNIPASPLSLERVT